MIGKSEHPAQDIVGSDVTNDESDDEEVCEAYYGFAINEDGCDYCGSHWHDDLDSDYGLEGRLRDWRAAVERENVDQPDTKGDKHE